MDTLQITKLNNDKEIQTGKCARFLPLRVVFHLGGRVGAIRGLPAIIPYLRVLHRVSKHAIHPYHTHPRTLVTQSEWIIVMGGGGTGMEEWSVVLIVCPEDVSQGVYLKEQ